MSYLGQDGQELTPEQIKEQQRAQMQAQQMETQREALRIQGENARALIYGQDSFLQSIGMAKPVATGVPLEAKFDWTVPVVVLVSLAGIAAIGGGFIYLVKSKQA